MYALPLWWPAAKSQDMAIHKPNGTQKPDKVKESQRRLSAGFPLVMRGTPPVDGVGFASYHLDVIMPVYREKHLMAWPPRRPSKL